MKRAAAGATSGAAGVAVTVLTSGLMCSGGAGGGTTPAANTNFAGGAQTGDRFTKPEELRTGALFDQVEQGSGMGVLLGWFGWCDCCAWYLQ